MRVVMVMAAAHRDGQRVDTGRCDEGRRLGGVAVRTPGAWARLAADLTGSASTHSPLVVQPPGGRRGDGEIVPRARWTRPP